MRDGWLTTSLGALCEITRGTSPTQKTEPGPYPLVVTAADFATSDTFQFDGEAVCVPLVSSTGHGHASLKRLHYATGRFAVANIMAALVVTDPSICNTRFLSMLLQHKKDELIVPKMKGTANVSLSISSLASVQVELPPLADQIRIVDLISALDESAEAASSAAEQTGQTFRSILAREIQPPGESRALTDVSENLDSRRIPVSAAERASLDQVVPYYGAAGRTGWIDRALFDEPLVCLGEDGNGLLSWKTRPIAYRIDGPSWVNNHAHVLRAVGVPTDWLELSLMHYDISDLLNDGTRPKLNKGTLSKIVIRTDAGITAATSRLMALRAVAREMTELENSLASLREELLSVLLSGIAEIPASYDRLLEASA